MTSGAQVRWYHRTEPWLPSLNTQQRKIVLTWLLLIKLCRTEDVKKLVADVSFIAYSKFVRYSLWHRRSTDWSFSPGQMKDSCLLSIFSTGHDGAECQKQHTWMSAWQQHSMFPIVAKGYETSRALRSRIHLCFPLSSCQSEN